LKRRISKFKDQGRKSIFKVLKALKIFFPNFKVFKVVGEEPRIFSVFFQNFLFCSPVPQVRIVIVNWDSDLQNEGTAFTTAAFALKEHIGRHLASNFFSTQHSEIVK
jgi:hypothetical protein